MMASTNHFRFMAHQPAAFQSVVSLNCSVFATLELRFVIENHIKQ